MDSQLRELREAVQASGLEEGNFRWEQRDARWAGYFDHVLPTLVDREDGRFFFAFEYHPEIHDQYGLAHDPGGHSVFFAPGRQTPTEMRQHLTWDHAAEGFREWLRYVAREKGLTPPGPAQTPPQEKVDMPQTPLSQPVQERLILGKVNSFVEREAEHRGRLWQVIGVVLGLALAALALFA